MAKARTIENIEKGEPEVDEALMRAPKTLHVHDEPTNLCCTATMDCAKEQDKKDATFSPNTDQSEEHQCQPTELIDADPPPTFVASSATEAEEKIAKEGRCPNVSTPVAVPKRAWRPKTRMAHEQPKETLNASGDLDWLFEEHGKSGNRKQRRATTKRQCNTPQPQSTC
jgi:hypothetical protein